MGRNAKRVLARAGSYWFKIAFVNKKFFSDPLAAFHLVHDHARRAAVVTVNGPAPAINEAVKQALIAGLGISVMPLIGIRNELFNNELQIIPTKGLPIKTTWSLIWMKGKKHSPVSNAFLDYVRKNKSDIVQKNFRWYEQYS